MSFDALEMSLLLFFTSAKTDHWIQLKFEKFLTAQACVFSSFLFGRASKSMCLSTFYK